MKKVLFIHGFEGSRDSNWLPWLERKLQEFHYQVVNETLPNPAHPDYDEIMDFLRDKTKDFTEYDSVVGHSLGGFFALKLAEEKPFDRLFLIAPGVGEQLDFDGLRTMWENSDVDSLQAVIERGVNFDKIQAHHKVVVFSDNDPYIPLSVADNFDESWKVVTVEGYGHFQMKEYPELFYRLMVG